MDDNLAGMRKEFYQTVEKWTELSAERDRLTAENAELRKRLEAIKSTDDELTESVMEVYRIAAAANATLDALREVVQSDEWIYAKHTDTDGQMERIEDILYPATPKETPDDNR